MTSVDLSNSFIQINRQTVRNLVYNDSNLLQLWTALQISMQLVILLIINVSCNLVTKVPKFSTGDLFVVEFFTVLLDLFVAEISTR